ncbi:MAG: hypothetical protein JO079_11615, partial [Frankiaceae bacterium]|nr:hypothetical protein [Frankiaceae bacterium]
MFRSALRRSVLAAALLAATAGAGATSQAVSPARTSPPPMLPSASPPPAPGHPGNPTPLSTRSFVVRGTAGDIVHVHLTKSLDFSTGGALVMDAHTSGAWGQLVVVPDPHDPRLVGAGAKFLVVDPHIICPAEPCENFTENVAAGQAPLPSGDYVFALLGPPGARLSFTLRNRYFAERPTVLRDVYSMPVRGREVLPVPAGSRDVRVTQTDGLEPGGRYVAPTITAETIQTAVIAFYAPVGGAVQWEYCFGAPRRPSFYTTGTSGSECDGDPATDLGADGIAAPTPKDAYGDAFAYPRLDRTEGTRGLTWDLVNCTSCHMRAWWGDVALDGWTGPERVAAGRALPVIAPPRPPPTALTAGTIHLAAGARGVVPIRVTTSAEPRRVDVMTLLDRTGSMQTQLPAITRQIAAALENLRRHGVDIDAGLSLAGSSALQYANSSPSASSQHPDATVDAANPSYRPPVLFTRPALVGSVAATLAALSVVTPEQMPIEPVDGDCCHFDRQQGQLEAIRQLLTGAGYSYSTAQGAIANVPPGLVAGWRTDPTVQRVLVDVTDQPFDRTGPITFTQPVTPPGDPSLVIHGLVAQRVHHVGLVVGGRVDAADALSRLSAATGAVVPAGGLTCGGSDGHWRVPAGAPFVCTASAAQLAIESAVLHLTSPT